MFVNSIYFKFFLFVDVLIMMGAAEKVLERCSFVMIDGKV